MLNGKTTTRATAKKAAGDPKVVGTAEHSLGLSATGPDLLTESLSARLRRETVDIHRRAERCRFVQALLRGELKASAYFRYLSSLYPYYRCLEGLLGEHSRHPALEAFDWGPLFRAPRLAADLKAINSAPAQIPACVSRIVERVQRLGSVEPAALLGHAYARYLGDLHGGRILGSVARQHFRFASQHMLTFHQFDQDPVELAGRFKRSLDSVPIVHVERDAIVCEAIASFHFAIDLFDEQMLGFDNHRNKNLR